MTPLLLILGIAGGLWYYEKKMKKRVSSGPAITDSATIADAQQMLAVFAATQGAQYSTTEPMSYWVQLFQNWANHGGVAGSTLRTDGILDASTLATLQFWFQHQSQAAPVAAHH